MGIEETVGQLTGIVKINLNRKDDKETEFVPLNLTPEAAQKAAEKAGQVNGCVMKVTKTAKKKSGA